MAAAAVVFWGAIFRGAVFGFLLGAESAKAAGLIAGHGVPVRLRGTAGVGGRIRLRRAIGLRGAIGRIRIAVHVAIRVAVRVAGSGRITRLCCSVRVAVSVTRIAEGLRPVCVRGSRISLRTVGVGLRVIGVVLRRGACVILTGQRGMRGTVGLLLCTAIWLGLPREVLLGCAIAVCGAALVGILI